MMTCLLQNMEVDRATPRLDPAALATSTSSGPDAVATESEGGKTDKVFTVFTSCNLQSPNGVHQGSILGPV